MYKTIGQVAQYKPISKLSMEELAEWQKTAKSSGGVLFACNGDGAEKNAARQQVLNLFHPDVWSGALNMLTMPGVNWRFERQLLGVREPGWTKKKYPAHTHFTGVENDRAIYYSAITHIPGIETPGTLIKPVKKDRFPFAELAIKSRHASFFFANIDDLLQHKWERPEYREVQQMGWDAAWLDYTGPLTTKRLSLIKAFYQQSVRNTLIVTSLRARWEKATGTAIEKAGGHSAWLRASLEGEVLHDLEYMGTSPMSQFAVRKNQKEEKCAKT